MLTGEVVEQLEEIAPLRFAESWDNVGLLLGERDRRVKRILLTIDLTEAVLAEAEKKKADLIVAYHPPIFDALKSVTDIAVKSRIILRTARLGMSIYSPHTALDAAPDGVNDWLAAGIGEGDVRPLQHAEHLPKSEQHKIVAFVPKDHVDAVRAALSKAGAGRIGAYEQCSFAVSGQGTFFGGDATSPVVGKKGRLEHVDEQRLEIVCSADALPAAIGALRHTHPYEEPAFDIYDLRPRPHVNVGAGRCVTLDKPITLNELATRIKGHLKVEQVRVAAAPSTRKHRRIGLCAGAGGTLLDAAIAQKCDAFLTGEMRHHDVLDAQSRGCSVILAGHTNTERGYLSVLRKALMKRFEKNVEITIARRDRDPLQVM